MCAGRRPRAACHQSFCSARSGDPSGSRVDEIVEARQLPQAVLAAEFVEARYAALAVADHIERRHVDLAVALPAAASAGSAGSADGFAAPAGPAAAAPC